MGFYLKAARSFPGTRFLFWARVCGFCFHVWKQNIPHTLRVIAIMRAGGSFINSGLWMNTSQKRNRRFVEAHGKISLPFQTNFSICKWTTSPFTNGEISFEIRVKKFFWFRVLVTELKAMEETKWRALRSVVAWLRRSVASGCLKQRTLCLPEHLGKQLVRDDCRRLSYLA